MGMVAVFQPQWCTCTCLWWTQGHVSIGLKPRRATHSSILAWRIPWREDPGRLQSMGLQRLENNWATNMYIPRKKIAESEDLCIRQLSTHHSTNLLYRFTVPTAIVWELFLILANASSYLSFFILFLLLGVVSHHKDTGFCFNLIFKKQNVFYLNTLLVQSMWRIFFFKEKNTTGSNTIKMGKNIISNIIQMTGTLAFSEAHLGWAIIW